MTALTILLCIACQFFLVGGQLFFKHAMSPRLPQPQLGDGAKPVLRNHPPVRLVLPLARPAPTPGPQQDLPLRGPESGVLVLCAWVVLKEKLPTSAWLGLTVVCVGLAIVAGS